MHHIRRFLFSNHQLVITDSIRKTGSGHKVELFFHFAEGLIPIIENNSLKLDNKVTISFNFLPSHIEINDDTLSMSYGTFVTSKTAVIRYNFDNGIEIETIIKKEKLYD